MVEGFHGASAQGAVCAVLVGWYVEPECANAQGAVDSAIYEVLDGAADIGVADAQPYGLVSQARGGRSERG